MQIRCCLKFGDFEYMNRLHKEGEIYMQSIECYKKYEHLEIGDKFEGMDEIVQKSEIKSIKFQMPEIGFEQEIKTAPHITWGKCKPLLHIYCMTGITDDYCSAKADSNNAAHINPSDFGNFGNAVCVIKDVLEFHRRFEQACLKTGYELVGPGKVIYYDPKEYSGDLSPIHKRNEYKHQEEIRYFITSKDENPICLQIGSLEDIADLFINGIRQEPKR